MHLFHDPNLLERKPDRSANLFGRCRSSEESVTKSSLFEAR
jgi:hypothetical protein